MNIFDIPELSLTDDERIYVAEYFMFEPYSTYNFSGLTFHPVEGARKFKTDKENFDRNMFDIASRLFKTLPDDVYGVAIEPGTTIHPHKDDYSSGAGELSPDEFLPEEQREIWDNLQSDLKCRRSIVCFPVTPKENYSKIFYPDTQESHGWSDHAFAFNAFETHAVETTNVYRLNLQFTFKMPFDELYQLYKNGGLVNECI